MNCFFQICDILKRIEGKVDGMAQNLAQLQQVITNLTAKVTQLQTDQAAEDAAVAKLIADVNTLIAAIGPVDYTDEVNAVQAAIDNLQLADSDEVTQTGDLTNEDTTVDADGG
jgi:hypothetical protein